MIKTLFFDIDGTLVSYKTHSIPASTLRALEEAKSRGIRIFIATGRPRILLDNISELQERNLIDGYITMDGSYCFIGETVIYKRAIPDMEARIVMEYCDRRGIACVVSSGEDICVCNPCDEVYRIFHGLLNVDVLPVRSSREALEGKEIFQMNPFVSSEDERELSVIAERCEINRWYPTLADITAKGNTKQRGIEEIIRHIGVSRDETMAFGDAENDVGMLRYAGIGVAVGNADMNVCAAAGYVTSDVEKDGVADALRYFGVI